MKKSNAKRNRCCDDVKAAILNRHKKCNSTKPCAIANGRKINCFFKTNALKEEKEYTICSNINDMLKNYTTPRCPQKRKVLDETPIRKSKRSRGIDAIPPLAIKIKKVIVKYSEEEHIILDEKESKKGEALKRRTPNDVILSQICGSANKYKLYQNLTQREKRSKASSLNCKLVALCVNTKELNEIGITNYLVHNKNVVTNVLSLIDDSVHQLQILT